MHGADRDPASTSDREQDVDPLCTMRFQRSNTLLTL